MEVFWETFEYIANTSIFFLAGVIIAERVVYDENVHYLDMALCFLLYLFLNLIRFAVNFTFLPLLSRMGSGMSWKVLNNT